MENDELNLVLMIAPLVGGTLFCLLGVFLWKSGRELRQNGISTLAVVLKKYRKGGGLENYWAAFGFTDAAGRQQTLEMKVNSRAWHWLREGRPSTIVYVPSKPEVADVGPLWAKKLVGGFLLVFALGGGGIAVAAAATLIWQLVSKSGS